MRLDEFFNKYPVRDVCIEGHDDGNYLVFKIQTLTKGTIFEILSIEEHDLAYITGSYDKPGSIIVVLKIDR